MSYFAVIRRRDENVEKSGTSFRSGNLQICNDQWDTPAVSEWSNEPWEVYHFEKRDEVRGGV